MKFCALIPELAVTHCETSLIFYCDVLGFSVRYHRKEEGFVFIELGEAQLMLDQIDKGRTFGYAQIPAERPFGWGVNLQIHVVSVAPLLDALCVADKALYLPLEEKWYRCGDKEVGQRQFIVADPDGYLLRFYEKIGVSR